MASSRRISSTRSLETVAEDDHRRIGFVVPHVVEPKATSPRRTLVCSIESEEIAVGHRHAPAHALGRQLGASGPCERARRIGKGVLRDAALSTHIWAAIEHADDLLAGAVRCGAR